MMADNSRQYFRRSELPTPNTVIPSKFTYVIAGENGMGQDVEHVAGDGKSEREIGRLDTRSWDRIRIHYHVPAGSQADVTVVVEHTSYPFETLDEIESPEWNTGGSGGAAPSTDSKVPTSADLTSTLSAHATNMAHEYNNEFAYLYGIQAVRFLAHTTAAGAGAADPPKVFVTVTLE